MFQPCALPMGVAKKTRAMFPFGNLLDTTFKLRYIIRDPAAAAAIIRSVLKPDGESLGVFPI